MAFLKSRTFCSESASTTSATASAAPTSAAPTTAAPASFTLVATGDVLIHQEHQLASGARRPDGSYDFVPVMAAVAPIMIPAVTGRNASPAVRAEYPSTFWT